MTKKKLILARRIACLDYVVPLCYVMRQLSKKDNLNDYIIMAPKYLTNYKYTQHLLNVFQQEHGHIYIYPDSYLSLPNFNISGDTDKIVRSLIKEIFSKNEISAVFFDDVEPKSTIIHNILALSCLIENAPLINIPHSAYMYASPHINGISDHPQRFQSRDYALYSHIYSANIFSSVYTSKYSDIKNNKMIYREVIGFPRYFDEWNASGYMSQIRNNMAIPRRNNLRVAILMQQVEFRVFLDELSNLLKILSKRFQDVEFKIIGHVCSSIAELVDTLHAVGEKNVVMSSESYVSEVASSDLILLGTSAVSLEAIYSRKPFLYLEYIHNNPCILDYCLDEIKISRSSIEVIQFLESKNRQDYIANEREIDKIKKHIVSDTSCSRQMIKELDAMLSD